MANFGEITRQQHTGIDTCKNSELKLITHINHILGDTFISYSSVSHLTGVKVLQNSLGRLFARRKLYAHTNILCNLYQWHVKINACSYRISG